MTDVLARARHLAADIVAARAEMDAQRRLPAALSDKLRDSGIYRLCIPETYGGIEAAPATLVNVLETLAEADASAAWCAMISATTGSLAAYLAPDVTRAIFSDPKLVIAGVYAPTGKAQPEGEAYRVSGQWKWNSNGQNATWLCGGCMIFENGAPRMLAEKMPEHRMMLFPATDARFADTWHTTGLRGTGSGDMEASGILVPRDRSVSFISDTPRVEAPLYTFPIFGLLALGIAAVASGNAHAAMSEFAALAASKRLPNGRIMAERGAIQIAFADTSARLASARAFLHTEVDACWTEAQSGNAMSIARRAQLRLAATHMTRTAADVVRIVQDLAGGAGVFTANTLHRRLADAQTMTAHIMIAPATYELTGRALLGAPVSAAEL